MDTIELFAGAGGLALGTSAAGFKHRAVVELDRNSCDTLRENKSEGRKGWRIFEEDVCNFDFSPYEGITLIAGGPPCQPFSIGGKARGHVDRRNLFPQVVRAIRETKPKAILIENVKGLTRPKFAHYFEYILLQLTHPDLEPNKNEEWEAHLKRLEMHHTRGGLRGLQYNVVFDCLNAANFGVAQRRERVFFVGFRSDLGVAWSFPEETHSQDSLLHSQWIAGDYWDVHKVAKRKRPTPSRMHERRVEKLRSMEFEPELERWQTVRDAIHDLPDPTKRKQTGIPNHVHNPGARSYKGHTGSPWDQPAKTLKAGDHGVPGGENMLAHENGDVRYFTVRESARLQTFPDNFVFCGAWTETMRQLGNAVPVDVAAMLATSIKKELARKRIDGPTTLQPTQPRKSRGKHRAGNTKS